MPAPPSPEPATLESSTTEVTVLRWPEEAAARRRLAARRAPRLLLIGEDAEPPVVLDELEDWVRQPLDAADLVARSEMLRRRVQGRPHRPVLDGDGLLRHAGRWVVIPDSQLAVVGLLVEEFGRLVPMDRVRAAYVDAGGSGSAVSIRNAVARVRAKVAVVGLGLHVVRGRGMVLDHEVEPRRGGGPDRPVA